MYTDFLENLLKYKTLRFKFVSFVIENLFSAIPLNKVIDMAAELLLNKFETISKDEIKKLKFCTQDVSFQFGAVLYKHRNEVRLLHLFWLKCIIKF